jgi:hypothetical protein
MRVIPPTEITPSRLTSSSAPEPGVGEVAYAQGTTYGIGDRVILGSPSSVVTISNAAPAAVTWATHGQPEGTPVTFSTTGVLPAPLVAGQTYYVLRPVTGSFNLSERLGGGPIVTTSAGSGTHTATTFVHRVYESLVAANQGNYPLATSSIGKWLDVGPTNRWAMFDLLRNTATQYPSPLTVVITPGTRVNAIGLVGLIADSVTIQVSASGNQVYSETISLATRNTTSWSDYLFGAFSYLTTTAAFGLPPYTNGVITLTFNRAAGPVSVGGVVIGTSILIGQTQYDAESDALNFSKVERTFDGEAVLIQRRTVPKVNVRVWCPKANVNKVRAVRDLLNAIPAFWSGLDDPNDGYFEAVQVLGIYKQMSINLAHPTHAIVALELEEV